MRKKILTLAVATVAASSILTGCGGSSSSDKKASADENITAVSREDGSGTRGAFIELFGIEEKDKDGNKVDKTTSSVQITNSTSVMMTTVAENKAAIGYISLGVVVGGSSSVTPVMEKLKEAYAKANKDVTVEVQQSDSTTGVTNAIEGTCDIGMASRDLADSETKKGVKATVIAKDGIAVIVNKDSKVDELTSAQVKDIYIGKTTKWADVK